jgi:hypothetical protein
MQKQKETNHNPTHKPDIEYRNAFRVLQRVAKLTGDQFEGDLYNMPITITYASNAGDLPPQILTTHRDLLTYAVETFMAVGFSLEGALDVLFSAKATKDVLSDMTAKEPKTS